MFDEELKDLGLTEKESQIYLLLLRSTPLPPSSIASKGGFHRPSVYDSLERMQEKGIVSEVIIEGKKCYSACPPEHLLEMIKLKEEALRSILPRLTALAKPAEKINVQVFKGKRAYRTLIKDVTASISKNSIIQLMGVEEKALLEEIEPIYLKQYFTILKEKKAKENVIFARGRPRIKDPNVEYRELDPQYIGEVSHMIYADKIAFFIASTPYQLIIIENKALAETMRKQFSFFWKNAL